MDHRNTQKITKFRSKNPILTVTKQQQVFIKWSNSILKNIKIEKLEDFCDGVALCELVETIFGKALRYTKKPRIPVQKFDNFHVAFGVMKAAGITVHGFDVHCLHISAFIFFIFSDTFILEAIVGGNSNNMLAILHNIVRYIRSSQYSGPLAREFIEYFDKDAPKERKTSGTMKSPKKVAPTKQPLSPKRPFKVAPKSKEIPEKSTNNFARIKNPTKSQGSPSSNTEEQFNVPPVNIVKKLSGIINAEIEWEEAKQNKKASSSEEIPTQTPKENKLTPTQTPRDNEVTPTQTPRENGEEKIQETKEKKIPTTHPKSVEKTPDDSLVQIQEISLCDSPLLPSKDPEEESPPLLEKMEMLEIQQVNLDSSSILNTPKEPDNVSVKDSQDSGVEVSNTRVLGTKKVGMTAGRKGTLNGDVYETAVALFDYYDEKSGRLRLRKGDMLKVMSKKNSGWWKGFIEGTDVIGSFPGNYVSTDPTQIQKYQRRGTKISAPLLTQNMEAKGPNEQVNKKKEGSSLIIPQIKLENIPKEEDPELPKSKRGAPEPEANLHPPISSEHSSEETTESSIPSVSAKSSLFPPKQRLNKRLGVLKEKDRLSLPVMHKEDVSENFKLTIPSHTSTSNLSHEDISVDEISAAEEFPAVPELTEERKIQLLEIFSSNERALRGLVKMQGVSKILQSKKALKKMREKRKRRNHIANEILGSEKIYVESLQLCLQQFGEPMKQLSYVDSNQWKSLFAKLEIILNYNLQLYNRLTVRIGQKWEEDGQHLGDIFIELGLYLKVYTTYVNNYNSSLDTFTELKENPKVGNSLFF